MVSMHDKSRESAAFGHVRVPSGHEIYWETSGSPTGKPIVFLHGGPGAPPLSGGYRRQFNPLKHYVVGIDQRGCGRSRPLVIDALDRLHEQTTQALIADIEAVRVHLRIERWAVAGVSWGTTLALAYAQAHPERVTDMVLVAVTTTSRDEVDWITEGIGRIFPEAWQRLAAASGQRDGERVVDAYARRLSSEAEADRVQAAQEWIAWENTHVSLGPDWSPLAFADPRQAMVFATLVTHYWSNDAFLHGEHRPIERMHRIETIPATLIHGRRDISGPAAAAWTLHRRWPVSRLHIVETEGHGGPRMMALMREACEAFA